MYLYFQYLQYLLQVGKIYEQLGENQNMSQREYSREELADLMRFQIEQTSMTGRETGFTVCGNGNVEIANEGTSNSVSLKKCPGLTMLFHTHPCGTPSPSDQDFAVVQNIHTLKKTCIGTEDGIRCYHPHTGEMTDKINL